MSTRLHARRRRCGREHTSSAREWVVRGIAASSATPRADADGHNSSSSRERHPSTTTSSPATLLSSQPPRDYRRILAGLADSQIFNNSVSTAAAPTLPALACALDRIDHRARGEPGNHCFYNHPTRFSSGAPRCDRLRREADFAGPRAGYAATTVYNPAARAADYCVSARQNRTHRRRLRLARRPAGAN